MSRILKAIINSAIEDNSIKRILYYPSTDENFNRKIFSLPYIFYNTTDSPLCSELENVFYCPNSISGFLSIDFNCIVINNPFTQFDHAINFSSQLHIPLIFLCKEDPPTQVKIESLYYTNEFLEKNCQTICWSQSLADKWLLTEYKVISSVKDIPGVLKEWTKLYLRK